LESAVNRLAQFTADASHELRTPVALIRTTAELTLRRRRTTEEYCEALTEIQAESERTSELIADLLTLARADAGQGSLPLEPADLAPLVEEACRQGRLLAGAKQVRLEASAPEEAVFVDANPPALRRLLLILLDNAVKYTPRGGTVRISVSAGPPAAITVTDTGTGIPEKELSRIFERFYRADPSRNRETGGSGLGLSIAQWIAEMHGAEIGAESAEGQGSEFRVRFSRSSA
jgi:signal transduction histidine kinase